MASVDVVMSVYNAAQHLPIALQSIQNQTVADIQIIIIDDGSTDNTRSIVEKAQLADPRIVYRYQSNAGIVAAVSVGMELCTAPFVARHDGDDVSYPFRFEKELDYLNRHQSCVAVSGLARQVSDQGSPLGNITRARDMSLVDDCSIPANEPYILQPLLMMRRDAYVRSGGYRHLTVSEDTDLYWRMSQLGQLHILPEVLGDYRIHTNSISSKSIVAGRRMSAWSQLSALSAQRRRRSIQDLEFGPNLQKQVDSETEMTGLYLAVTPLLREDEKSWFFSAMAAKLVEICYYRPFELTESDIDFILSVPNVDPDVRARRYYAAFCEGILSAGIRMVAEGRIRAAFRLIPREQWAALIGRAAFRIGVPSTARDLIKRFVKPASA